MNYKNAKHLSNNHGQFVILAGILIALLVGIVGTFACNYNIRAFAQDQQVADPSPAEIPTIDEAEANDL